MDATFSMTHEHSQPDKLQRMDQQFWMHLLSGTTPPSSEDLCLAAPPATLRYQEGEQALCVLFCLRRWHGQLSSGSLEYSRFGAQNLARRTLLRAQRGCSLPWKQNMLFLLYDPQLPEEELRRSCIILVEECARCFGCDVSCYFGTPCQAHEVPGQVHCLVQGDMDNVSNAQAILSIAEIAHRNKPPSLPVLRDWMPYLIDGKEEEFCRCIERYFQHAIAVNNLDRSFLAQFQQDLIQEIGFALKNAGIPLHHLFSETDELLRMEKAIRYVPDMLEWVRDCVAKATALLMPDQTGKSVSQRVCDYLNRHLFYPFRREELAHALQLSEGHIARTFRKEMGMSIAEYLTKARIRFACLNIQQTGLCLAQIAERCGFYDYPSFYRAFKKYTGLSPTEYQAKKSDFTM